MHLLRYQTDGTLSRKTFLKDAPSYAILSHRWVDDEPTYQDITNGTGKSKKGYEKLLFCGRQAAKDGLEYFWADTVCIDKQSSAELTSSLNSMFRWYRESAKCYVYMSDVTSAESDFPKSEWFTRGWTLQELIAPKIVEFFSVDEHYFGDKRSLDEQICAITKIPVEALRGEDLKSFSVEERMSWVQSRTTTLEEDRTYCLLGIFNIFMPVIYGEGNNALDRLRKKIRSINAPSTGEHDNYMRCKNALYHPDLLHRHSLIKSFDSSQWLFEHPIYLTWNTLSTSGEISHALLTLKGNPGTGKSVLMKEASRRAEDTDALVLHHFFDRSKDSESTHFKTSLNKFCTSILYQLLSKIEPKPWSFLEEWGDLLRFKPGLLPWNLTQLQDAIREVIVGHEKRGNVKVRIFIDAVDECGDDGAIMQSEEPLQLLRWIEKLLHSALDAGADVRVCVSRTHLPAYGGLEPPTQTIIVEAHNQSAIDTFVSSVLAKDNIDSWTQRALHKRIMDRCTNDFLWTTVVTESILAKSDDVKGKELLKLIDELPSTHKKMYERALQIAASPQGAETLRLLQVISIARRPMSVDEFREAIAFKSAVDFDSIAEWERSKGGFESGERFKSYIRRESRGLVEPYHTTQTDEYLRFVHASVTTFLRDSHSFFAAAISPWAQHSHLTFANICFRAIEADLADATAFNGYANENWVYHARDCEQLFLEISEIPTFMSNCAKRASKRVIEQQIHAIKDSPKATQSHLLEEKDGLLVLLATLGCTHVLRRHVEDCSRCKEDIASFADRYCKALQNSIIGRWTDTTMWLLEKHCDADFQVNQLYQDQTLLYKASYFGQLEVMSFLLDKGADPSQRSPIGYEYPLHVAIELGNEAVVRVLLQHTSCHDQFKLRRNGGNTPLHNAVKSRQATRTKLGVLKLLLKKAPTGVGIMDIQDDKGDSVVTLARRLSEDGGRPYEKMLDEIEDFYEEDQLQ
ncbi:hypothetical protein DE146DRAFT_231539 [Phaeosphaeria sp. MPI-PUGE-AT-0046c]|nr:hypothetical protein DE146DRAFT_231539 [Phaeosphaeria sp. MPI-PUGE-AT-0046c]